MKWDMDYLGEIAKSDLDKRQQIHLGNTENSPLEIIRDGQDKGKKKYRRDMELERLLESDKDGDLRDLMKEAARGKNQEKITKTGKGKWWREILPPHIWKFLKEKGYAGKVVRLPMFPTKNYPEDIVRELYIYRLAGRKVYVPKYYRSFDEDWVVCARILKRQGRNIREIAEILNKSTNTVRKILEGE